MSEHMQNLAQQALERAVHLVQRHVVVTYTRAEVLEFMGVAPQAELERLERMFEAVFARFQRVTL